MSGVIHWELRLAAGCILAGMGYMMVYDVLRILRGLTPHGTFLISLEDVVYWVFCSLSSFTILYRQNDGTLRGFAIAGVVMGMLAYNHFISRHLVVVITRFLRWLLHLALWPFELLFRPFRKAGKKVKMFVVKTLQKILRSIKIKLKNPHGSGEKNEKKKKEGQQL